MAQLDLTMQKRLDQMEQNPYTELTKQIQMEYELAYEHQSPTIKKNLVRLRMYDNQRRKKDAAGDTTMFTIHQTILASLYDDRLMSTFEGREAGDEDTAENLTSMAENDYDDMDKDQLDFVWDWDTTFFGRGILLMTEYVRDPANNIFVPAPENIDPVVFLRDPRAASINGIGPLHRKAARFFGREVAMTRSAMQKNPKFSVSDWTALSYNNTLKELFDEAQRARAYAQGNGQIDQLKDEGRLLANAQYVLTEWYTHWNINGTVKKVRVWLANKRSVIVGFEVLKSDSVWPALDRPLYPHSHTWDATSIPDLTEDKQRLRAVAQNLGIRAMKADLYPNYVFDTNKIDKNYNFKFAFNKFIPANGDPSNAVQPMRKATPNMVLLDFIYNSLDASAQKATATPEIQQGVVSAEKRTLGELNLVAGNTSTRYSLTAKIFGWSERQFWRNWYQLYKIYFADNIDEKVLRLRGAFGSKWRKLTKDQIICNIDPDVTIESKNVSRAKQLEDRQLLSEYFLVAMQEPTSNRRWALKKLAKLNSMSKDEIERLYPPTIDERVAEDENLFLNDNKLQPIHTEDDHNVHLEVHASAAPTKATFAHIEGHKKALLIKKTAPDLFPQDQAPVNFQAPGTPTLQAQSTGQAGPIAPSQAPGQGNQ